MPKVPLTFACGLYDRMLALYTGEVQVEGADLNFIVEDNPRSIFDRMAGGWSSTFRNSPRRNTSRATSPTSVRSSRFRCSPRGCSATASSSSTAGTSSPEGPGRQAHRRAGLHHDRGDLHPRAARATSTASISRTSNGWKAHQQRRVTRQSNHPADREEACDRCANNSGKSLSDLLEEGELHAIIGTGVPRAFGRNPDVARLYPDFRAAEMDYYRRTKIFPIMHTVVIRRDVHERHPFVATSLYKAFDRAKAIAQEKLPMAARCAARCPG
jgi:4,5-dihydroxyphthalate decarboxylase